MIDMGKGVGVDTRFIEKVLVTMSPGLQIYGGPGSFSHDFKIWPIAFQGSGPSGPILFSCKKSHFNKKNSSYSKSTVVNTVKHVLSSHTKILITNGSLMKVKSIAECSHWTFDLH